MARANSSERLKAEMKRGIIKGITDFAFSMIFPSPILAPLLFWASIILPASSVSIGMNLKERDIIVAVS